MPARTSKQRPTVGLIALSAWALLLCSSKNAQAQQCEQDADCPDKFSCEVTTTVDCGPAKQCADGEQCPPDLDCEPMEYRSCVSPSCQDDSDCPSDMVCYEQTISRCGGSTHGCGPNEDCPEPVDAGNSDCEEMTTRSCVARYVPPCSDDADCGDGFKCEEQSISMCSGGGSTGTGGDTPSVDGGQANPQDSGMHCTTMPTGTFRCELQPIQCEDESDCPDGFSCEEDRNQAACGTTEPAAGSGASSSEDASCPDDTGSGTKSCLPPYYDINGGDKGGQHSGSGETGGDASVDMPPTAPIKKSSGGCSISPSSHDDSTSPNALFALLVIGLLIRRAYQP